MSTLNLSSSERKTALVDAVAYMADILEDRMLDKQHELSHSESYETGHILLRQVNELRKQIAFIEAFRTAVDAVPVGMSVYLEPNETEVIREGLQSLVDNDVGTESSIYDVISESNIKNVILATSYTWGAIDPARLAKELSRQARETLESNTAASDLLAALS